MDLGNNRDVLQATLGLVEGGNLEKKIFWEIMLLGSGGVLIKMCAHFWRIRGCDFFCRLQLRQFFLFSFKPVAVRLCPELLAFVNCQTSSAFHASVVRYYLQSKQHVSQVAMIFLRKSVLSMMGRQIRSKHFQVLFNGQ